MVDGVADNGNGDERRGDDKESTRRDVALLTGKLLKTDWRILNGVMKVSASPRKRYVVESKREREKESNWPRGIERESAGVRVGQFNVL